MTEKRVLSNNCSCPAGFYDDYPQFSDCQSNIYLKKNINNFINIECPVECTQCLNLTYCYDCVGV